MDVLSEAAWFLLIDEVLRCYNRIAELEGKQDIHQMIE